MIRRFVINSRVEHTVYFFRAKPPQGSYWEKTHTFALSILPPVGFEMGNDKQMRVVDDKPKLNYLERVNDANGGIFAWCKGEDGEVVGEVKSLLKGAVQSEDFLSKVLGPTLMESKDEIERLVEGKAKSIYKDGRGNVPIVDLHAEISFGRAPEPEDTIGLVLVQDGCVYGELFDLMPLYRLVSLNRGVFCLPSRLLHERLRSKAIRLTSSV